MDCMGSPCLWDLLARAGWLARRLEQLAGVEALGLQDRTAVVVEPVRARAVVVELDAVAVRIGQVDRDRATVVGAVVDRMAVVEQPLDGAAELTAVGVQEATW
jgi:hypothetical protein